MRQANFHGAVFILGRWRPGLETPKPLENQREREKPWKEHRILNEMTILLTGKFSKEMLEARINWMSLKSGKKKLVSLDSMLNNSVSHMSFLAPQRKGRIMTFGPWTLGSSGPNPWVGGNEVGSVIAPDNAGQRVPRPHTRMQTLGRDWGARWREKAEPGAQKNPRQLESQDRTTGEEVQGQSFGVPGRGPRDS